MTNGNEINLKLENDKKSKSKIFIDTFADKANNNSLSDEDIAWGVKSLNSMLEGLYNADELFKLQQAGIDAAAGIMIDGKPVNFYPNIKTHSKIYSSLSQADLGKIKCDIISKALQGAKIDIIKFKSDENGNIEPEKAVSVKTDAKLPKKSFFQRFLELIGFRSKEKKKIIAANNEPRNLDGYFKEIGPETDEEKKSLDNFKKDLQAAKEKLSEIKIDENTLQGKKNFGEMDIAAPQKPQMFSAAKKLAINAQFRGASANQSDKNIQLMEDFFGEIFPQNSSKSSSKDSRALNLGRMLKKQFQLTDDKGKGFTSLYTIDRKSSLISFVTLYGMGKGHSIDEITAPENSELRKTLGRQFIDDLGSMEYSDFLKKNGLENADDETKKQQYKAYFTNTRDKIEEYYVKGFDAIRKEELFVPDPNNLSEFLKKSQRFCMLGTMITDLKQSWDNLNKKTFASENENDKKSLDKFKSITEYMKQNLLTAGNLADCMDKYRSFFASRDFVEYSGENIGAVVNAAQAKSVLQYFKDTAEDIQQKTGKMEYIAQLCDKPVLCSKLEELFAVDNYTDKGIANAAYNHCLCNDDAAALTVVIDPETNKILKISENNKGVISETKELFQEHMESVKNSEEKVKEFIPNLDNLKSDEYNIGMTFGDAYESFFHPEKQTSAEKTVNEKAVEVKPIKEQTATMSSITPEQAQFLKKAEEHNAKVYETLDEAVEKLGKEQISFNELLGDKTSKTIMPPEKKAPEKQLEMSK